LAVTRYVDACDDQYITNGWEYNQKIISCPYAIHPPASMVSWWVLVHFGLHFASIFWKQPNKLVDLVGEGLFLVGS